MSKWIYYSDDGRIAVDAAWHGLSPALDMIDRDTGKPRDSFEYLGIADVSLGGDVVKAHVFRPKGKGRAPKATP